MKNLSNNINNDVMLSNLAYFAYWTAIDMLLPYSPSFDISNLGQVTPMNETLSTRTYHEYHYVMNIVWLLIENSLFSEQVIRSLSFKTAKITDEIRESIKTKPLICINFLRIEIKPFSASGWIKVLSKKVGSKWAFRSISFTIDEILPLLTS